ncbi:hypothetical protein CH362_19135, partial [Leptospira saintgironsiae]
VRTSESGTQSKEDFIKNSPYNNPERYKTTVERAFEQNSVRQIENDRTLSAKEKEQAKSELYERLVDDNLTTQYGANQGLKLQVAATVEYMRGKFGRNGSGFEFDPKVWGNDAKARTRFEQVKALVFGNKPAAEIGNSFGSPICKMYAGYVQGIMNGAYEGSFAQYMVDRFKTGDVDFTSSSYGKYDKYGAWLPSGPAPVYDMGGENPGSHERGVYPSY